jgi:hypothetical protein
MDQTRAILKAVLPGGDKVTINSPYPLDQSQDSRRMRTSTKNYLCESALSYVFKGGIARMLIPGQGTTEFTRDRSAPEGFAMKTTN